MRFDRHGNRIWASAKTCWTPGRPPRGSLGAGPRPGEGVHEPCWAGVSARAHASLVFQVSYRLCGGLLPEYLDLDGVIWQGPRILGRFIVMR
jgi:hypothetical protein